MSPRHPLLTVTIRDCRVDTFRSGGKGGQHQNKTESGVRVTHEPSGAVGESRTHRSQLMNKREAFRRMAESPRFQVWVRNKARELMATHLDLEERVEAQLAPQNLRIEVKDDQGRWVQAPPSLFDNE